MAETRAKITQLVQDFLRSYDGDVGEVTFRIVKDALAPKFGEEWNDVLQNHKAFMKDEARRLAIDKNPSDRASEGGAAATTPEKEEGGDTEKERKTTVKKQTKKEDSSKGKRKSQQVASSHSSSSSESDASQSDDEPRSKKPKKEVGSRKKATSKDEKNKPQAPKPISPEVQRLKDLAKKLGVNVPVNVFKGSPSDDELEDRLGDFLRNQGLSSLKPGPREISQLRNKIQLSKELDGIESTNIVRGRRRNQDEDEKMAPLKSKYRIRPVSDSEDSS